MGSPPFLRKQCHRETITGEKLPFSANPSAGKRNTLSNFRGVRYNSLKKKLGWEYVKYEKTTKYLTLTLISLLSEAPADEKKGDGKH